MRDPARIDRIVNKLRRLWHANPDLRLGQLVHIATTKNNATSSSFHVEDDVTERLIDALQAQCDTQAPQ